MIGLTDNTSHDYRTGPGVCCEELRVIVNATPLHLLEQRKHASGTNFELSEDHMMRSAVRCAVLEPDEFPYRYALMPEGIDRRSKIGRELFAETEAEGKTPLKPVTYDSIMGAANSLRANKTIRFLLGLGGKFRQSIYWKDPATGVLCKMRPHYFIEPCQTFQNGLLLEFKPCSSARQEAFREFAARSHYHMLAEFMPAGFQQVFGTAERPPLLFAAYETRPPYPNKVYPAGARQAELGRIEVGNALAIYAECERTGQWPGYGEELTPLDLPGWADKELQDAQAANA